jgi:hypothetical protein
VKIGLLTMTKNDIVCGFYNTTGIHCVPDKIDHCVVCEVKVTEDSMGNILDLDIDDDDIVQDVTNHTVYTINSTPELYKRLKGNKSSANISAVCYDWAKEHGNEFGDLFQTELDMVNWHEVSRRV